MIIASIIVMQNIFMTCAILTKFDPKTTVSIDGVSFRINGELTYKDYKLESHGRLMNVRMVNSVFDDENPKTRPDGFDPEANTDRFIKSMNGYKSKGIMAFTINLQGGFPGYEGALNSAFNPDGSLKDNYMACVSRVIESADERGMIIILGLFYQRQDQILEDENAVRNATINAVKWVQKNGYKNVMIEIANEYPHGGFDHKIIKDPYGEAELIGIVHSTVAELLVSTSGIGDGLFHPKLCEVSDFILIHGNGCNPDEYDSKVNELKKYGKPIVFNEDWCFSDDPRGISDAVQKV
ncbi:MAG: hypothetical protein QG641_890, partial [Candidatus Poribacteria bacterium]|nr:hypothetical protein [Candidatus Poribacteria bacterium]